MKFFFIFLFLPAVVLAAPNEEWAVIVAMDAGPRKKPSTQDEARSLARTHLATHKQLIEQFLARYPNDPRVFDAKLRLASILAAIGGMENTQQLVDAAMRILAALEKSPTASREKRANAGFRRVSLYLQSMRGRENEMCDSIVDSARNFVLKYPGDRRGPRLLVEVATICDNDPKLKRQLLERARELSTEESLKRRIADDFTRLEHLDKPLSLKFQTLQGGIFDTGKEKGNVVMLVFWSAESPHSLLWMQNLRRNLEALPQSHLRIALISLDTNRKAVLQRLKEFRMDGKPAYFDGKGWENAIAHPLGINAVPTVFVLDKEGILRTLNARDNYIRWGQKLLRD